MLNKGALFTLALSLGKHKLPEYSLEVQLIAVALQTLCVLRTELWCVASTQLTFWLWNVSYVSAFWLHY